MVCLAIASISPLANAAQETTKVVFLPASGKPAKPKPFFTGPRIAATMLATSGITAVFIGAVYASRSDDAFAASKTHCLVSDPDICKPEGYELRKQATQDGRVGTTALGVGTTAVFLSIALAWINPEFHDQKRGASGSSAMATKFRLAPVIGASRQGVVLSGVF
jgi:hypothetical protein